MKSLYKNGFEHLYDAMYQTFIDYHDEYAFYSSILRAHQKMSLLEIGCGTGRLAAYFIASELDYQGLDISQEMIDISKKRNPSGHFIRANITQFKLPKPVDSAIITGRTTSYLSTNNEVTKGLRSLHCNLNSEGILCFDFIDASRFFLKIEDGVNVTHVAKVNGKHYIRESYMKKNIERGNLMFDWDAKYYELVDGNKTLITSDTSTVRAFTRNEWELLLNSNGFQLLEFIDRKSYAFDTYVAVAKKV